MIDNFALAISHGLMMLAAWILLRRADLDHEPGPRHLEEARPERLPKQAVEGDRPGA
jgi:hypothetical protein